MQRIMIIGGPGSGKSTLARALGIGLNLPVIHSDKFYYTPGWVMRPPEETTRLFLEAAEGTRWIMDGNNSTTRDARAERAELIIHLSLHRLRRLSRCLWRSARTYGRVRPDMAPGCPERFDFDFYYRFVWNYENRSSGQMAEFLARWQGKRPILDLPHVRAVNRLIRDPRGELTRLGIDPAPAPR